ncbi:MAG: metallophosphoesterase [Halanaerobiaceae bacterium]
MSIYAIADLHLSFENPVVPDKWEDIKEYKSMSIFGEHWQMHYKKIYNNWINLISRDDVVLIPGDISWATNLDEMKADIDFLEKLPGKKIFIRGNHDYWWKGINGLRTALPDDFYLLQNDSVILQDIAIAGTRAWTPPNSYQFSAKDRKIYDRELIRLELSLKSIKSIKNVEKIIVMLHYMPTNEEHEYNQMIALLEKYNVDICIYGHLHGFDSHQIRLEGEKWGIKFKLVSSDFLQFKPCLILP